MKKVLQKYKEISEEIICCIKNDDLVKAEELMNCRQEVLEGLNNKKIDKTIDIEKEFSIRSIDQCINDELIKAKLKVKNEMNNIKKQQAANSIYGRQFENIYFINKQI